MASFKFVLSDTNRPRPDGTHPIAVRIISNRVIRVKTLGYFATPDQFKSERAAPEHPDHIRINKLIAKYTTILSDAIQDAKYSMQFISADTLIDLIQVRGVSSRREKKTGMLLKDFFDNHFISRYDPEKQFHTIRGYKWFMDAFLKIAGNDIELSEITSEVITDFINKRKSTVSNRTINLQVVMIKSIYKLAVKNKFVSGRSDPFSEFNLLKTGKNIKKAIRIEELQTLETLVIDDKKIDTARDIWLFMAYNWGMRIKDAVFLKWSDISGNVLKYRMKKTDDPILINIQGKTEAILNKYRGKSKIYVFGLFDESSDISHIHQFDNICSNIRQRLYNLSFMAGLKVKLTPHMARHTFATLMSKAGVEMHIIKEFLGHETEKQTRQYIDNIESETANLEYQKAMARLGL